MLANALEGRGGAGGRGAGVAGSDGAVNAQRMRALEGQVLQAKMESNESKEDAAKVIIKMVDFCDPSVVGDFIYTSYLFIYLFRLYL